MRDLVRAMVIPITGCISIAIIFLFVTWAGNFDKKIINEDGRYNSASKDLGGYAVMGPTTHCDNSYFPVCGNDGLTYDNACRAVAAGTQVAYRGGCQD